MARMVKNRGFDVSYQLAASYALGPSLDTNRFAIHSGHSEKHTRFAGTRGKRREALFR